VGRHSARPTPQERAEQCIDVLYNDSRGLPELFTPHTLSEVTDHAAVFTLFQRLTCPIVCVGKVDHRGWHRRCQQRAADAMEHLGYPRPDLDPVPAPDSPDWDY